MKNLVRALRYFQPDAPRIALAGLLLVLATAANLLKPWPLAILVDDVLGNKPLPPWLSACVGQVSKDGLVAILSIATLLLHLGQGALSSAQNYLSIQIGLRGLTRVRSQIFAALQKLSLRFYQGARTGDLIYRATWDAYSFQTLFQQGLVTLAASLLALVLMVFVMCRLNWRLTALALVTVPMLLVSIKIFGRKMRHLGTLAQQADSRVISFVQQTIAALPLIQSDTRENDEERKFTVLTARAQEQRLAQHGWELLYWCAVTVAFSFGMAALVWMGGRQVQAGRLTVGELFIFLAYLGQLYEPLNQISHVGSTLSSTGAGTGRVFELLDAREQVRDAPDAIPVRGSNLKDRTPNTEPASGPPKTLARKAPPAPPAEVEPVTALGNIAFDRVSFGYQPERAVLRDLSFEVAAGESLAIIGPSGAGKTTLLNLLPRFYDPTGGTVRLEGFDLRKLRIKELRAQVALVPQEPILLPATIGENIAYSRPDATAVEIEAAARAAGADGFIQKLPDGYHTIVGEGAARLSVGERQRLNLARAFLKDAPILLLDEPTSALDAESEALVVAGLEKLTRGRTTLVVAHRLSTIRGATKILVLRDGAIAEMGAPETLLSLQGYYAQIVGLS
jgi:ATP-binding cassette subfamily B protein